MTEQATATEQTTHEQVIEQHDLPTSKAFVTSIDGHTRINAPAQVVQTAGSVNLDDITDARKMLWVEGRFVGADKANRNGHLWSAGDLQLAEAGVAFGPLNWLHEMHYIIGSITDSAFHPGIQQADLGTTSQPHITAKAGVWRWIWPDEAWVVETASEAERLWFSMECISRNVACAYDGQQGCGTVVPYKAFISGAGCEHLQQRGTVKRFVEPIFLGGAIVVPPAQPGWSEADAHVLAQAASLAEETFDQAGRPDIPATEWEQMMRQIVALTEPR